MWGRGSKKNAQNFNFAQYGLSQQEVSGLQNYFTSISGRDQRLDFTEFAKLYAQLNPQANGPNAYDIATRVFSIADANHDGFVSFEEFLTFYVMNRSQPQNFGNNMYNYLNDRSGNTGYLTPDQAYQYAHYAQSFFGNTGNVQAPNQFAQSYSQYGGQIPISAFVNQLSPYSSPQF